MRCISTRIYTGTTHTEIYIRILVAPIKHIIIITVTVVQVGAKRQEAKVMVRRNLCAAALKGVHSVALRVRCSSDSVMNVVAITVTM